MYLSLGGLDEALATRKRFKHNEPLQVALALVFCAAWVLDGTAFNDENWSTERAQNSIE